MKPLYPLTEAQKCLYLMLPLAYSCNFLLAKTTTSSHFSGTILDKPWILELLVCMGNPLHKVEGKAKAERS